MDIADSNNSHQVSNLSKCTKIDKKVDKNDSDIPDYFVSSIRYDNILEETSGMAYSVGNTTKQVVGESKVNCAMSFFNLYVNICSLL